MTWPECVLGCVMTVCGARVVSELILTWIVKRKDGGA